MRRARKGLRHSRFVWNDSLEPYKMLARTQLNFRRLERHEAVYRAVDAKEATSMVHFDDGEPAFRAVCTSCDILRSLLDCPDLIVPELKRGMDDDAIEHTRVALQDLS